MRFFIFLGDFVKVCVFFLYIILCFWCKNVIVRFVFFVNVFLFKYLDLIIFFLCYVLIVFGMIVI